MKCKICDRDTVREICNYCIADELFKKVENLSVTKESNELKGGQRELI